METGRLGEKEMGRMKVLKNSQPETNRWLSGVEATNGDLGEAEKRRQRAIYSIDSFNNHTVGSNHIRPESTL
jgi:hypothetical protein